MKAPVYILYGSFLVVVLCSYLSPVGLSNFYQNYLAYTLSLDSMQLMGYERSEAQLQQKCRATMGRKKGNQTLPYLPCGLQAQSMFNDTFHLSMDGTLLAVNERGIAWSSDLEAKFKNPSSYPDVCVNGSICLFESYPSIVSEVPLQPSPLSCNTSSH